MHVRISTWLLALLFATVFAVPTVASAALGGDTPEVDFPLPRFSAVVVGDKVWSLEGDPSVPQPRNGGLWEVVGHDEVHLAGWVRCPDIDEKLPRLTTEINGVVENTEFGGGGDRSRYVHRTFPVFKPGEACVEGPKAIVMEFKPTCSPFVGSDTFDSVTMSIGVDVTCDPPELKASSRRSKWTHMCPPGYEVQDYSQLGYGESELENGSPEEQCRFVYANQVKPLPTVDKHPDVVAMESYEQALALARAQLAVFNRAGLFTVFDLAKTHENNVTSVLGIAQGKAVAAASRKAIGPGSIVDPNWAIDEYFLIQPTWFVDPRIRGTNSATTKIDQAQNRLLKLQKKGIITLDQLASASPKRVAKLTGVSRSQAGGWVAAARRQTVFANNPTDLAVHRDWIIHPLWMIDPGLLPSARVVRSHAIDVSGKPTVTAYTGADLTKVPPASPIKTVPKLDAPTNVEPVSVFPPGGKSQRKTRRKPKSKSKSKRPAPGGQTTRPTGKSRAPRKGASRKGRRKRGRSGRRSRRGAPRSGTGSRGSVGRDDGAR